LGTFPTHSQSELNSTVNFFRAIFIFIYLISYSISDMIRQFYRNEGIVKNEFQQARLR
jgi:hypothetical protein